MAYSSYKKEKNSNKLIDRIDLTVYPVFIHGARNMIVYKDTFQNGQFNIKAIMGLAHQMAKTGMESELRAAKRFGFEPRKYSAEFKECLIKAWQYALMYQEIEGRIAA